MSGLAAKKGSLFGKDSGSSPTEDSPSPVVPKKPIFGAKKDLLSPEAKLKKQIVPYERVYEWFREDKPVSRIHCSTKDMIILALLAALAYQFKRQKRRMSN